MQWNNFTQLVFVVYIFICPLLVSTNKDLSKSDMKFMLVFDMTFMVDRVMDLFVGYYKPDGTEEGRLAHVMWANFTSKFFLELFIITFPFILHEYFTQNSLIYLLFKIPRYSRLFESDD